MQDFVDPRDSIPHTITQGDINMIIAEMNKPAVPNPRMVAAHRAAKEMFSDPTPKHVVLFTSEAVSPGHPDKVADQISDAILDEFLTNDPEARVAVETLVTKGVVHIAGEVRSTHTPDYEKIVRAKIAEIGYCNGLEPDFDAATVTITNDIHEQAAEIAQGVDAGHRESEGAGDQGLMFGYAVADNKDFMPEPIYKAHKVLEILNTLRKDNAGHILKPDAKCQLTYEYVNGHPVRLHTLLVSHSHAESISQDDLKTFIVNAVSPLFGKAIDKDTRILINPTGSFVNCGPATDTGLTGRKIIVDSYGGSAHHGGGAFSGKDPTKVDRSAAYAARYLAKNIVASCIAKKCEIQLCYAIGVAEPLAININTFGTLVSGVTAGMIEEYIRNNVSLTPRGIRTRLELNKPIYQQTSKHGHFGHEEFAWEKTDLAQDMFNALVKKEIV